MTGGTTDEVFHFRSGVFCGIKELWSVWTLDLFTFYMHKKIQNTLRKAKLGIL